MYSVGDTISITFSAATNAPPVDTKEKVDRIFEFSAAPATNYYGEWSSNNRTLTLYLLNVTNATDPGIDRYAAQIGPA